MTDICSFFVDDVGLKVDSGIRSISGGPIGEPSGDVATKVTVELQDLTVRDALTSVVPREKYGPELWRAIYQASKKGPVYEVVYLTPPNNDEDEAEGSLEE